jgi:hypothetical protein
MTEELNKTEARQGDRRRTNLIALVVGVLLVVVVFLLIYGFGAPSGTPVGTN